MEFSNLWSKCDLLYLSDYLANGGELIEIPEKESYEKTVRKAEKSLFSLAERFANNREELEELDETIGIAITTLRRTFFEMGLIGGIKLSHVFYTRAKELEE